MSSRAIERGFDFGPFPSGWAQVAWSKELPPGPVRATHIHAIAQLPMPYASSPDAREHRGFEPGQQRQLAVAFVVGSPLAAASACQASQRVTDSL